MFKSASSLRTNAVSPAAVRSRGEYSKRVQRFTQLPFRPFHDKLGFEVGVFGLGEQDAVGISREEIVGPEEVRLERFRHALDQRVLPCTRGFFNCQALSAAATRSASALAAALLCSASGGLLQPLMTLSYHLRQGCPGLR